jgi:hypothetical protein
MPAPSLDFTVRRARVEPSASPLVLLDLEVTARPRAVRGVLLATQVRIALVRRSYDRATRERMSDLFGDPRRWADQARGLLWVLATSVLPAFDGQVTVPLALPCSYDLEVAWAKYLDALRDGVVPIHLLFSGSLFYEDAAGALLTTRIPWDREARFDLPVAVLREAIDACFPGAGWVRVGRDTLDRLRAYRAQQALPTWDATLDALIDGAAAAAPAEQST